ncbi:MAG: serine/threonine-protein kinase [bacterium]
MPRNWDESTLCSFIISPDQLEGRRRLQDICLQCDSPIQRPRHRSPRFDCGNVSDCDRIVNRNLEGMPACHLSFDSVYYNAMEEQYLGDYKIVEPVGEGAMGKVYLAHHKDIPAHQVILKELKNPRHLDRFADEANNMAILNAHPDICTLYNFFKKDERTFIVMEYIEGITLKEMIDSEERVTTDLYLRVAVDVLGVLSFAHEKGIYHRDIKPSNIMVNCSGKIKVIDFGIAKRERDVSLTADGTFFGTLQYAAPEQFNFEQKVENWVVVDLYALGSTLYFMLTRRVPYLEKNFEDLVVAKRLTDPAPPSQINPEIDSAVDNIVMKSLHRDPSQRYQSAMEMIEDIGKVRLPALDYTVDLGETVGIILEEGKTRPIASGQPRVPDKPKPWQKLKYWLTAAVIVIAVAVGSYLKYFGDQTDEGNTQTDTLRGTVGPVDSGGGVVPAIPAGTLSVEINAPSEIWVDDTLLANAVDRYVLTLDTGEHRVRLVNERAEGGDFVRTVAIIAEERNTLRHDFVIDSSGTVDIRVEPWGDVYFDGELIDSNTSHVSHRTAPGIHEIRAENPTARNRVRRDTIRALAFERVSWDCRFELVPDSGRLVVSSIPIGASIYINGELQPNITPYTFTLFKGEYNISVSLPTYPAPRETTLTIVPGESSEFVPDFDR